MSQERRLVLHDLRRDLLERPTEAHLHGQAPGGCIPVLRDRLQLGGALPGPGRPPLGVLRRPFLRGYAGEGPGPADRLNPINHAEYPPRGPRVLTVVNQGAVNDPDRLALLLVAPNRQRVHLHGRREGAPLQDLPQSDRRVLLRFGVLEVHARQHLLCAEEKVGGEVAGFAGDRHLVVPLDQRPPLGNVLGGLSPGRAGTTAPGGAAAGTGAAAGAGTSMWVAHCFLASAHMWCMIAWTTECSASGAW